MRSSDKFVRTKETKYRDESRLYMRRLYVNKAKRESSKFASSRMHGVLALGTHFVSVKLPRENFTRMHTCLKSGDGGVLPLVSAWPRVEVINGDKVGRKASESSEKHSGLLSQDGVRP